MADFDTLIKGGMVFDGRRSPRFKADVGIRDGTIARIGNLSKASADRVIDATGCNVAPGFIDLHTHYDSQVFWDPYCSPSSWHGVTTVTIGNCGFGFAPVRPEERDRAMLAMTRNEAVPLACMQQGMPWDWVTFPEFLASLERSPKSINLMSLIPLNPLMAWVMGTERGKAGAMPTDEEHAEMARLVNEAMDAGAGGISAQRLGWASPQRDYDGKPMITDVMHDETMLHLARVLGERGEGVIQYTYYDFAGRIAADMNKRHEEMRHFQDVARISGRPLLINASTDADRKFIAESREMGLRIYGIYSSVGFEGREFILSIGDQPGSFDSCGDAWADATVGTIEEVKAKLADPRVRDELRTNLAAFRATFGNLGDLIFLQAGTDPELEPYDSGPLEIAARGLGYTDILDAFLDINIRENLKTRWQGQMTGMKPKEDNREGKDDGEFWDSNAQALVSKGASAAQKIAEDPYGCPCVSDGGAHTKFLTSGHFGVFFLINHARANGWLSLEDAHYKLSGLPAVYADLDRGTLVEGAPADIIVYDYDELGITEAEEIYDYPAGEWRRVTRPIGMHYVLVNGQITMDSGAQTEVASGRLIRQGKPRALEIA